MKKEFVRAQLKPDQLNAVRQMLQKEAQAKLLSPWLLMIADVLDNAVSGSNSYVTVGVTKDKTAIICTITYEGSKLYASGATMWEVADKLNDIL